MGLEPRLDQLERDMRRWRGAALAALVVALGCAGVLAVQATRPREVVTDRLTVVDSQGRKRIVMGAGDAPGHPVIDFRDEVGKSRVRMGIGDDEASVVFFGGEENGQAAVLGYLGTATGPGLFLDNEAGTHSSVFAGPDGPRVVLSKGDHVLERLPMPEFPLFPAAGDP